MVTKLSCLGHVVAYDGTPWQRWNSIQEALWRSFFREAGSQKARDLPFSAKLSSLDRCTLPALTFRAPRWALGVTLFREIGGVRRDMVGSIIRVSIRAGEEPSVFGRRRHLAITEALKDSDGLPTAIPGLQRYWGGTLQPGCSCSALNLARCARYRVV